MRCGKKNVDPPLLARRPTKSWPMGVAYDVLAGHSYLSLARDDCLLTWARGGLTPNLNATCEERLSPSPPCCCAVWAWSAVIASERGGLRGWGRLV